MLFSIVTILSQVGSVFQNLDFYKTSVFKITHILSMKPGTCAKLFICIIAVCRIDQLTQK